MRTNAYSNIKVEISLGNLVAILDVVDRFVGADEDCEKLRAENEKLEKECKCQAKEINDLRCELSTRPNTCELHPVTLTAIENAKHVLEKLYRPVGSEECLANETVPADCFHDVYKVLKDLVDRLGEEGPTLRMAPVFTGGAE